MSENTTDFYDAMKLLYARANEEAKPRTDMPETDYPVTIIGCIRGVDGWYLAGYDKKRKTVIPMESVS